MNEAMRAESRHTRVKYDITVFSGGAVAYVSTYFQVEKAADLIPCLAHLLIAYHNNYYNTAVFGGNSDLFMYITSHNIAQKVT